MALLKPTMEYEGVVTIVNYEMVYDKRTTLDIGEETRILVDIPANSGADFYELVGKYKGNTYFRSTNTDISTIGQSATVTVKLYETSLEDPTISIKAGGDIVFTAYTGTGSPSNPTAVANAANTITLHVNAASGSGTGGTDPDTSEEPPVTTPDLDGRIEQFQNCDGVNIFPRTIIEAIFSGKNGASLEKVLEDIGINAKFYVDQKTGELMMVTNKDYTGGDSEVPAGQGIPSGGTAGQVLMKKSLTDYDTKWGSLTASMIGAVPESRKVNGQALEEDITLFSAGTTDLIPGVSPLATGKIYLVYE